MIKIADKKIKLYVSVEDRKEKEVWEKYEHDEERNGRYKRDTYQNSRNKKYVGLISD